MFLDLHRQVVPDTELYAVLVDGKVHHVCHAAYSDVKVVVFGLLTPQVGSIEVKILNQLTLEWASVFSINAPCPAPLRWRNISDIPASAWEAVGRKNFAD